MSLFDKVFRAIQRLNEPQPVRNQEPVKRSAPPIGDPFLKAHVEETQELYDKLKAALPHVGKTSGKLNPSFVVIQLVNDYPTVTPELAMELSLFGNDLQSDDGLNTDIPEFDIQAQADLPIAQRVAFRNRLRRKFGYFRNYQEAHKWWHSYFAHLCEAVFAALPSGYAKHGEISFDIPLIDAFADAPEIIENIVALIVDERAKELNVFVDLRARVLENLETLYDIHKNHFTPTDKQMRDVERRELVQMYLGGTPLVSILTKCPAVISIPEEAWFEHAWCLAPPGTGKTQLIQYLISERLPQVEDDECSVIVMDSQGDLINQIRTLKCFAPGEPLHDKLIILEPNLEHAPALNIFDFGGERMNAYSADDREKFTNIAITQMTYVLDALMGEGGAMTTKQETLYRYIVRLLMETPNATLATFTDILQITKPDQLASYGEYIGKLQQPAQDFFANQFLDNEFAGTKRQVAWRIANLRENTYFDRMFSHPKSKLDLFAELNSSKVILINTDKERLGEDGTNVFGRYFIGALLTASQERASLSRSERRSVFAFIDECQDYIGTDAKIASLLDQARKMRVSMFLAHQRSRQIKNANVLDALANTAIKFASTDNPNDADLTARALYTTREFVGSQPRQHFALYVRRQTQSAVSVKVPFLVMEEMEKMTAAEQSEVMSVMHKRYSTTQPTQSPRPPSPPPDDPDNPSTDPTDEW